MAYQVTGPVLDLTDTKIVVEKGKEKWEIARDKSTKVTGDLKKGARVTVEYNMTATSIEAKDTKPPAAKTSQEVSSPATMGEGGSPTLLFHGHRAAHPLICRPARASSTSALKASRLNFAVFA